MDRFLKSVSYFALRAPDDGTGSAQQTPEQIAQAERDTINVEVSNTSGEHSQNKNSDDKLDNDDVEDDDSDDEDENEDDESDENEDDDANNEENDEEETDDQRKVRLAKEKEERRQARVQKRIDKITSDRNRLAEENEALKRQLSEKPDSELTQEEVDRRAELKANEKLILQRFNDDKAKLQKQGEKADKDFNSNVKDMADDLGLIPSVVIGVLADLDHDNGGEVLAYLAKPENVNLAEDIYELQNNPVKLGQKLAKLSDKLHDEKTNRKRKGRSGLPPPIRPINENNQQSSGLSDSLSMDEWVRRRDAQAEAFAKQKRGF